MRSLSRLDLPNLIRCSDLDVIADRIPGGTLPIMQGTGHVALMGRPDELNRICLDFL